MRVCAHVCVWYQEWRVGEGVGQLERKDPSTRRHAEEPAEEGPTHDRTGTYTVNTHTCIISGMTLKVSFIPPIFSFYCFEPHTNWWENRWRNQRDKKPFLSEFPAYCWTMFLASTACLFLTAADFYRYLCRQKSLPMIVMTCVLPLNLVRTLFCWLSWRHNDLDVFHRINHRVMITGTQVTWHP